MVETDVPMVDGDYRHYKGGLYKVIAIALAEGTKVRQVVYRGADGRVWVRPLDQWFGLVHPNHGDRTTVQRFTFEAETQPIAGGT